uniref:Uncharacterized protein n=1 Tax=Amphora coffeiformis TaxID=265554 RepID=A0A7S3LFR4_9STRA
MTMTASNATHQRPTAADPSSTMILQLNRAVSTPYGDGKIVSFDPESTVYTVRLAFGTLYAVSSSLVRRTPGVELNAAYQSLEKMRKLNLEVQCHELGIPYSDQNGDYDQACTICLLETADADDYKRRWRIPQLRKSTSSLSKGTPCLICGSPTCPKHQSTGFKKQSIVLCHNCERLFDLDFASLLGFDDSANVSKEENINTKKNKKTETTFDSTTIPRSVDVVLLEQKIRTLVDTYDRVMLLLAHASQFIPDLVTRLVETESRNNRIGLGTAGVGIVSGALGLAGAATILTPMGAPLLMASLALSGSSAAVTVSHHAMQSYFFQNPHEATDRIIVMHSMVSSLLNAAQTLQRVAEGAMPENDNGEEKSPKESKDDFLVETFGQGLTIVRQADTGLGLASVAAASSASLSTAAPGATNLIQSSASALNAVPLLGTALSGIFIAMDANRLKSTLGKIKAGNPSDKAHALENMQGDLLLFPQTADLEVECQAFCQIIEKNLPQRAQ